MTYIFVEVVLTVGCALAGTSPVMYVVVSLLVCDQYNIT
jgi:hypothetical protein